MAASLGLFKARSGKPETNGKEHGEEASAEITWSFWG